jgi:hypothetical protein
LTYTKMYNITVRINSGTPGDPVNEDLVIRPSSEIARSRNGNVIAKRQGDFAEDTQIPDLKWVAASMRHGRLRLLKIACVVPLPTAVSPAAVQRAVAPPPTDPLASYDQPDW